MGWHWDLIPSWMLQIGLTIVERLFRLTSLTSALSMLSTAVCLATLPPSCVALLLYVGMLPICRPLNCPEFRTSIPVPLLCVCVCSYWLCMVALTDDVSPAACLLLCLDAGACCVLRCAAAFPWQCNTNCMSVSDLVYAPCSGLAVRRCSASIRSYTPFLTWHSQSYPIAHLPTTATTTEQHPVRQAG
jgi:hypothetical protein